MGSAQFGSVQAVLIIHLPEPRPAAGLLNGCTETTDNGIHFKQLRVFVKPIEVHQDIMQRLISHTQRPPGWGNRLRHFLIIQQVGKAMMPNQPRRPQQ